MKYKKYLLLSFFAFIFCYIHAQTESEISKDSIFMTCKQCDSLYNQICPDTPYFFAGHPNPAIFPGGYKKLMIFLKNNIQYPSECREKNIQGRVIVRFIIDESGKIICPYLCKSIHPALDKEALRIVKLMPNWKSASKNGVPCKSCFSLPILFKI